MMIDELKLSILNYAFSGQISKTKNADKSVEEMKKIIEEKHLELIEKKIVKLDKKVTLPSEKEYPYCIPNTWYWSKLYFVIDVRDGTHDSPKYHKQGVPLITSKNLNIDGTLDKENVKYISSDDADIINNRSKVDVNDILFAMIGSIGNPVIIMDEPDFCIKNVALFKNPNKDVLDNEYLYYYLVYSQIKMKKESSGGVQQFVSLNYLRNFYIPIPPIEEQKRIVEKIKALFEKLEEIIPIDNTLRELKSNLPSEMKKSIVDYAIHGLLTKQLSTDSSVKELIPSADLYSDNSKKFNLKIEKSEIPYQIPDNWEWVKIGMLFNYQNGYSYKPTETSKNSSGVPVIKSQNIMKRMVDINEKTSFVENPTEQMLKSKIVKGDFLMCLSSQSSNPEPLGKTAIYENDDIALLNQRVLKLTPLNPSMSQYLYYAINSFYFHNTVSHKGGGSAQSNLKLEHVMEMYIPIPPIKEQKRIVDKLNELLPLCDDIENLVNSID